MGVTFFDPFGDFDLLFGEAKLNFKLVDIPIRYVERTYGETNISRSRHGILLLRMMIFALRRIKFSKASRGDANLDARLVVIVHAAPEICAFGTGAAETADAQIFHCVTKAHHGIV